MEEQQGDRRHEGVRRGRRASFKMRKEQGDRRTSQTGCLGLLFLINFFPLGIFWSLQRSIAVLLSLQSLMLVVCIVLIWRHRPDVNPTQYFLIAMGFYLLMFGLCVGIGNN
jgi:hypothetical protein